MGRPWEYPRWRRVLMQVSMWVILGGTLGLAHFITRERQSVPISLDEPVRLGPVLVRLPTGWTPDVQDEEFGSIGYLNPERTEELQIEIKRLPAGTSVDEPLVVPGGRNLGPIEFTGLKRTGILARLPLPAGPVPQHQFVAAVVTPARYLIRIEFTQADRQTEAESLLLLKAVANGITAAR